MPLTARVLSGQSSPALSTGGGSTALVWVGVGAGLFTAGGTTGLLTSGAVASAVVSVAALVFPSFDEPLRATTTAITTMTTRTSAPTPNASARRRR